MTRFPSVRRAAFAIALLGLGAPAALAQSDLFIRDTPADTGIEPNPDAGPMWVSEDLWVRRQPDPNYRPGAGASWAVPAHQNPEYRDPMLGTPNYVYVRVRNRNRPGAAASTGNERLTLHWTKASTGLQWRTHWEDYMSGGVLSGAEVTKPRRNAATVSQAERDAYVAAILAIDQINFPGGPSYWDKQNQIHATGMAQNAGHRNPAFLPWHREFINRYEILLRRANPTLKLLYWDWEDDPRGGGGAFDYFTNNFMGAIGNGTAQQIGAPFAALFAGAPLYRNGQNGAFRNRPDANVFARPQYNSVAGDIGVRRRIEVGPYHNGAHSDVGGAASIVCPPAHPLCRNTLLNNDTAARDPFFFLLHANVDRLWADWQRRNPSRIDRLVVPNGPYGTDAIANPNPSAINMAMTPWRGDLAPWLPPNDVDKTSLHASVVAPPVYDTAPVRIPVLQPGESVVIEIPWYPPNPADFTTDRGHFCLLARIEEPGRPNLGMNVAEGVNVSTNTRNNNNIAWKNITVIDDMAGASALSAALMRNVFDEPVVAALRFEAVAAGPGEAAEGERFLAEGRRFLAEGERLLGRGVAEGRAFVEQGRRFVREGERFVAGAGKSEGVRASLELPPEIVERWRAAGAKGEGVELVGETRIAVTGRRASIEGIELAPGEELPVGVALTLPADYEPSAEVREVWDLVQLGTPGDPGEVVGGVRFELDTAAINLVPAGSEWRFWDRLGPPEAGWTAPGFDDAAWASGRGDIGFGNGAETTLSAGRGRGHAITSYFRRGFEVEDPGFLRSLELRLRRNDGAIVYLNGEEVYRDNMPAFAVDDGTLASRDLVGLERDVYVPVRLDPGLLVPGRNVVAVELHLAARDAADANFDLSLRGNLAEPEVGPSVAFRSPAPEFPAAVEAGRPALIQTEALHPDRGIAFVSLFLDGRLLETRGEPPFDFLWNKPEEGVHQLRLEAVDDAGGRTAVERVVSVIANMPPAVAITAPVHGATFAAGEPVPLAADAFDAGGAIAGVEFYLASMDFYLDEELVHTAASEPFAFELADVPPGDWMSLAGAVDDGGAMSFATPVHFTVTEPDAGTAPGHH
jgi:hypothetical protein